jgi:hypothetical protein
MWNVPKTFLKDVYFKTVPVNLFLTWDFSSASFDSWTVNVSDLKIIILQNTSRVCNSLVCILLILAERDFVQLILCIILILAERDFVQLILALA